jgi:hypothetical protein
MTIRRKTPVEIAVVCFLCRRRHKTILGYDGFCFPILYEFCEECEGKMLAQFEHQMQRLSYRPRFYLES